MTNIADLITLLDAIENLPSATRLRGRSYDLLRPWSGATVVDVGCGAGRAVSELDELGASAIGVDLAEEMITIARQRYPGQDFRIAGAYDLPLDDGTVAGYRADKVVHVLDDAPRALREAARVLAPGGRIVLVGQDWDAFVIDSGRPELTRTIVHARADQVTDPRAARRYRNMLLDAGFTGVEVEAHTEVFTEGLVLPLIMGLAQGALDMGAITREQFGSWTEEQADRVRRDRFFVALPLFVASATRP
ncbi:methyltransferase domain-containing protein [Nonomuraea soli]|uniref:SAM-dependent methyltransferase n=1 Tax=Nonomuraea soli TaxID=1032476 RepID=A0A7W0CII3_9ACTN|nr:methyltransferase domain-containing protein [Nonomuraea soli]MBA2891738.1 SAM-dependent methyltransferase [Nonomuraea soli]